MLNLVKAKPKGNTSIPLTQVINNAVQIRSVDDRDMATVVLADNTRIQIQIAPGQQWIANNPF